MIVIENHGIGGSVLTENPHNGTVQGAVKGRDGTHAETVLHRQLAHAVITHDAADLITFIMRGFDGAIEAAIGNGHGVARHAVAHNAAAAIHICIT